MTNTDDRPAVLFLCVHNAGRSQMAAGFLRHHAGDWIDVYSGGSSPADSVNSVAVEAMAELDIDITGNQPQRWTEEIVKECDVIVSMGCGDECPIYPGTRFDEWELTDPAGQGIELVRQVRDEMHDHVRQLIESLQPSE